MATIELKAEPFIPESISDEDLIRLVGSNEEVFNGRGSDTPADLEDGVIEITRAIDPLIREGHRMSGLTKWYSIAHKKWNSRSGRTPDGFTIHHMAGNLSKQGMENCVYNPNRQMSCNYAIYSDGSIECFVGEQYRAWTSSSYANDVHMITIEVANNSGAPNWTISAAALKSLIELCADICERYNISPRYNGKTTATMTVHQMFANTACPGPYLLGMHKDGSLAKKISDKVKANKEPAVKKIYRVQCGAFSKKVNAVNLRQKLINAGFSAILKTENGLVKVQVGAYTVKSNAEIMASKLKAKGFAAVIVEGTA